MECGDSSFPRDLWDETILGTETFYTVAHDALKLAELFLPAAVLKSFRNDQAYKVMYRIRSPRVRHSYDKPDGDPSGASGFDARYGPVLKSGRQHHDAGYT